MYEYIEGALKEKNPTHCVIETGGVGYFIHISLSTYTQLEPHAHAKLFIHQVVSERMPTCCSVSSPKLEREMFRLLLTVSGIGANTARMMLSSLSAEEIRQTILVGNASLLQGIKGIGAKTAQRIIIDLRDKIGKDKLRAGELFPIQNNRLKDEALSALVILGFNKGEADKVISKILVAEEPDPRGSDQKSPETVVKALNNPNLATVTVHHIIKSKPLIQFILCSTLISCLSGVATPLFPQVGPNGTPDSTGLRYPFRDELHYPFSNSGVTSPLYLGNPSNVVQSYCL